MSEDLIGKAAIALVAGFLGFFVKWFLAERAERHQLRRSIAPLRARAYRSLWRLCRQDVTDDTRTERADELKGWYERGGGLYLSLAASQRYFAAVQRMGAETISDRDLEMIRDNLTWLRTELKQHVGSYTSREAHKQIELARTDHVDELAGAI